MSLSNNEIIYALGWTLVHSLWQACLISIFVACTYAVTQKKSAQIRYWTNAVALIACVMASLWTFSIYLGNAGGDTYQSDIKITATLTQSTSASAFHLSEFINAYINQIVFIWLGGFLLYAFKYCSELLYCQHVKQHKNTRASSELETRFIELKNGLGITKEISLRISTLITSPCAIGHFKPVVLLPASIVLKLSTQQIEAILLHELGHIKRNDYVISALQNMMKSIYFFNPFIRWISMNMDEERENACDDIAVNVIGDPLFYANTLKEFTEINLNQSLTLNLTGRKNMLLNRIKRLFIKETNFGKTYAKTMAVMALFLVGAGFSISSYSTDDKSANDVFSVKLENEPLSSFLKLAQDFCPNFPKNIQLKNADTPIKLDLKKLPCTEAEKIIMDMDNDFSTPPAAGTFKMMVIHAPLSMFVKALQEKCPDLPKTMTLKNADKATSINVDLTCADAEKLIRHYDESLTNQP